MGTRSAIFRLAVTVGIVLAIVQTIVQHKPQGESLWFEVPVVLAMTVPLLAWPAFPFTSVLAVGAVLVVASFSDHTLVYDLAPAVAGGSAVFLVGMSRERSRAFEGLACAVVVVGVAVTNDPGGGVDDVAAIMLGLTPVWLLGLALRRKYDEAEAARADAQTARSDERARIARELHDVVGHAISLMTVQAGAVRRLLREDQARELEALRAIESAGREALAEMRRMVGVLRSADEEESREPQPGLGQVGKLVAQARDAGLPVGLRIEGAGTKLAPGVDLTAYRIVQEALTNAIKHADASRADVLVRYTDTALELTVTDDGSANGSVAGKGHGLIGMRERVGVFGGELEAGPSAGGGYSLHARLPFDRE